MRRGTGTPGSGWFSTSMSTTLKFDRDSELFGRYYLADVEVARDIAERFILFLGDDEVEFLADDALQFAYGGVTAMQDAWLEAQKKKRRHRRAAEAAARRKDDEPRSVDLDDAGRGATSPCLRVRRRPQTASASGSPHPPDPVARPPGPGRQSSTGPTPAPDNGNVPREAREPPAVPTTSGKSRIRPCDGKRRGRRPGREDKPDPATFEDMVRGRVRRKQSSMNLVPEEAFADPSRANISQRSTRSSVEDTSWPPGDGKSVPRPARRPPRDNRAAERHYAPGSRPEPPPIIARRPAEEDAAKAAIEPDPESRPAQATQPKESTWHRRSRTHFSRGAARVGRLRRAS